MLNAFPSLNVTKLSIYVNHAGSVSIMWENSSLLVVNTCIYSLSSLPLKFIKSPDLKFYKINIRDFLYYPKRV